MPHWRLYFLADEELLELLRNVKSPAAVQPHLAKLFEGVRALEFTGGSANRSIGPVEVQAMVSAEGERVAFTRPLKVRHGHAWHCASTASCHTMAAGASAAVQPVKAY